MYIEFNNCWNNFTKQEGFVLYINFCDIPLLGVQIDSWFISVVILGFSISIVK
jgi:hypothetical protein